MYIWLETTFGTVQKWSLRPLLDSPKGGINIGILLYIVLFMVITSWLFIFSNKWSDGDPTSDKILTNWLIPSNIKEKGNMHEKWIDKKPGYKIG